MIKFKTKKQAVSTVALLTFMTLCSETVYGMNENEISIQEERILNFKQQEIRDIRDIENQQNNSKMRILQLDKQSEKVLAEIIKKNKNLKTLDLRLFGSNPEEIGNTLASAVKNHPTLEKVYLSADAFNSKGKKALIDALKLTRIKALIVECSSSTIIKQMPDFLNTNKTLTRFEWDLYSISEDQIKNFLEALLVHNTIQILKITRADLDDKAASHISKFLEKNKSLTHLDLGLNEFTDEGAKSLAKSIKDNKSLLKLSVGGNDIDKDGVMALLEIFEHNCVLKELHMGNHLLSNEMLVKIADFLKKNTTLTHLDLSVSELSGIVYKPLITLKGIAKLAEALKINKSLVALNLGKLGCRNEHVKLILEARKDNQTLKSLGFSRSNIDSEGVQYIAENLGNLTFLDLNFNKISDKEVENFATVLETNNTLKHLKLFSSEISKKGVEALLRAFQKNTTLTKLQLNLNKDTQELSKEIEKKLEQNKESSK